VTLGRQNYNCASRVIGQAGSYDSALHIAASRGHWTRDDRCVQYGAIGGGCCVSRRLDIDDGVKHSDVCGGDRCQGWQDHAVGIKADALALRGTNTRTVDLQSKVLLPGFIDAHGHVFNAGFQKLSANLLPPPDGGGKDIASLLAILKDWQAKNAAAIEKAGWIIGFGYDDSQLAEKRHPSAKELDQVSTTLPVVIIHQSGHLGAMNHKGLEVAGFTACTPDPPGGVIHREADGKTPDGVLEEMAFSVRFSKFWAG